MIRSVPVAEIIRFYEVETDDPYADYVAVCTIVWETKDIVWIKAMNGRISKSHLIELANWLIARGVKKARASRVRGKRLPFSSDGGEYQEIVLDRVLERLSKKLHESVYFSQEPVIILLSNLYQAFLG